MPLTTTSKIVRASRVPAEKRRQPRPNPSPRKGQMERSEDSVVSYFCVAATVSFVQQQWLPFVKQLGLPFVQ